MRALRSVLVATALVAAFAAHDVATAGDAPRAIADLENDLVADDPAVRAKAAAELTDRFPDGAVAVPMLVDLLDDESPDVVAAAARAIDSMAVAGAGALTAYCADDSHFKPKLRFSDSLLTVLDMKKEGIGALGSIDLDELPDAKTPPEVAVQAALLPAGKTSALPLLLTMLRTSQPSTRAPTAAAMAMQAAEVVATRGLAPPEHRGRAAAAIAASALLKTDIDLKAWAGARLLARLRAADPNAIAALSATLTTKPQPQKPRVGEPKTYARSAACDALGALGPAAAAAAPVLLDSASKKDGVVADVRDCVRALLQMGKEADVVALLAKNPPTADDLAKALALEKRGAPAVVSHLAAMVKAAEFIDRDLLSALATLGPAAAAALPPLKERTKSADMLDVLPVVDTILAISATDPDGTRILEAAFKDKEPVISGSALIILTQRATPTSAVVVRLQAAAAQDAAGKPVPGGDGAVEALGRCGPMAKAAVNDLVRILAAQVKKCADLSERAWAAQRARRTVVALGKIGPDAAAAVPALTALRDKGDETIRVAAAQALRRIRAKK